MKLVLLRVQTEELRSGPGSRSSVGTSDATDVRLMASKSKSYGFVGLLFSFESKFRNLEPSFFSSW